MKNEKLRSRFATIWIRAPEGRDLVPPLQGAARAAGGGCHDDRFYRLTRPLCPGTTPRSASPTTPLNEGGRERSPLRTAPLRQMPFLVPPLQGAARAAGGGREMPSQSASRLLGHLGGAIGFIPARLPFGALAKLPFSRPPTCPRWRSRRRPGGLRRPVGRSSARRCSRGRCGRRAWPSSARSRGS